MMEAPPPSGWFPVLHGTPYRAISFAAVALHRARIEDNHDQTLERLKERGGLDWFELWCGFTDRPLFPGTMETARMKIEDMRDFVIDAVAAASFRSKVDG